MFIKPNKETIEKIATALGGNWYYSGSSTEADKEYGVSYISNGDIEIGFFTDDYKKPNHYNITVKALIYNNQVLYDYYYNYKNVTKPSDIYSAHTKTPEKIANDIKRRLLPDAIEYEKVTKEYIQSLRDTDVIQKQQVDAIVKALTVKDKSAVYVEEPKSIGDYTRIRYYSDGKVLDIEINGTSLNFKGCCNSFDKILAICNNVVS